MFSPPCLLTSPSNTHLRVISAAILETNIHIGTFLDFGFTFLGGNILITISLQLASSLGCADELVSLGL